ncbi:hypothetical protein DAT35_09250 [Vitiosangium sp. GDMCC 1.1324]|nr:hypothetical protein DAT35_09250 [Vitiosangium sp. GDMCC 1.1324]
MNLVFLITHPPETFLQGYASLLEVKPRARGYSPPWRLLHSILMGEDLEPSPSWFPSFDSD